MGRNRFACVEPRHAHTRSLHWAARIECLCTTTETPLFCPGTRCFSPLVTACTPPPCARGRLTVDAILLFAKPLPSFSFVSDISCRGRHLNGCSSSIKRCALACLAFKSHGWLSVAEKSRQHARFCRDRRWALLLRCARTDVPTYVLEIEGGGQLIRPQHDAASSAKRQAWGTET